MRLWPGAIVLLSGRPISSQLRIVYLPKWCSNVPQNGFLLMKSYPAQGDHNPHPDIVSRKELWNYYGSDNALLAELGTRTQLYRPYQFGSEFNTFVWSLLQNAKTQYEYRQNQKKRDTLEIAEKDGPDHALALMWMTWYAILWQEIDSSFQPGYDGTAGSIVETGKHHFLASFRKGVIHPKIEARVKVRNSQEHLDAYFVELCESAAILSDNIVLAQYSPDSIDQAVGAMTKIALIRCYRPLVEKKPIETSIDDIEDISALPGDDGCSSNGTVSSTQEIIGEAEESPFMTIARWILDDDCLSDRSNKGAVGHVLFGFTKSERLTFINVVPYLAAGDKVTGRSEEAIGNREQISANGGGIDINRVWPMVKHKIYRLLYLLGGLGPRWSFNDLSSLKTSIKLTDKIYRGHINGNVVLQVLDSASWAAIANDRYNSANVTADSLHVFLTVPQGRDPNHEARDKFTEACGELPIPQPSDPVVALHYCEDSYAVKLGRLDPVCILAGSGCPGHPIDFTITNVQEGK